ncbi:hypothetical protein ACSBR2_006863 [Camellia fascicularis]
MVSPKSRTGESVPCDYCNDQIAVLYCRADSAKLCLFCDQHVHSANALSRKHLRSQICDNCGSEPVSVRCATDNLLLCHDCDWDAHGSCSVSASHDRNPVEGFSGSPSALELASALGVDLEDKKPQSQLLSIPNWNFQDSSGVNFDSWMYKSAAGVTLQDLMVPSGNNAMMYSEMGSKRQSPSCGKQNQVLLRQLMELFKREVVGVDDDNGGSGGGENLVPNQSDWQQADVEGADLGSGGDDEVVDPVNQSLQQQQHETPFTSLLMMQTHVDPKSGDQIAQGNVLWDTNHNSQGTQVLSLKLFFLISSSVSIIIFLFNAPGWRQMVFYLQFVACLFFSEKSLRSLTFMCNIGRCLLFKIALFFIFFLTKKEKRKKEKKAYNKLAKVATLVLQD